MPHRPTWLAAIALVALGAWPGHAQTPAPYCVVNQMPTQTLRFTIIHSGADGDVRNTDWMRVQPGTRACQNLRSAQAIARLERIVPGRDPVFLCSAGMRATGGRSTVYAIYDNGNYYCR